MKDLFLSVSFSLLFVCNYFLADQNSSQEIIQNSIFTGQDEMIDSIVYEIFSRGVYEKIKVTRDGFGIYKSRNSVNFKQHPISMENWQKLTDLATNLDIENIHRFQAPTNHRMVDGAPYAFLEIITKGEVYKSADFDHKNPPKQLLDIMNVIYELREQLTKE